MTMQLNMKALMHILMRDMTTNFVCLDRSAHSYGVILYEINKKG
jgi:hypothetical protein